MSSLPPPATNSTNGKNNGKGLKNTVLGALGLGGFFGTNASTNAASTNAASTNAAGTPAVGGKRRKSRRARKTRSKSRRARKTRSKSRRARRTHSKSRKH